ncbi:nascent polypeptide-associated complex, alpha subunit [Rhizoclosmatium globosum]|uniref:Nascent polypeptide-associated complex subunit alpha n=1 Tax=Rhizoclosmatium globosum TaxID=329046 RepID=A0A1Y2BR36_9FUNG|nr:nascent polypeptide-associated complex, alpha subunit [Rhizoclosmatium globosum]|eukprot:ORY37194.1 nascent polypeptide-associated complex, alpha subunit [Rhizoclosmatium globosum]
MTKEDAKNANAQLEAESEGEEDAEVIGDEKLQSKGERKARKALSKHGLKRVEGVTRVTMKRARNMFSTNHQPPTTSAYVVFGEIKVEDMAQTMAQAQRDFAAQQQSSMADDILNGAGADDDDIPDLVDEPVDESGLEEKDIELVMSQANVARPKAVKALKANDGDIVNAIMELTL